MPTRSPSHRRKSRGNSAAPRTKRSVRGLLRCSLADHHGPLHYLRILLGIVRRVLLVLRGWVTKALCAKEIFSRYCLRGGLPATVPCTNGKDASGQWPSASCSNQDSASPTPQWVAAATHHSEVATQQALQLAGGVGDMLYGINVLTSLMSWLCHLLVFRFIVVRRVSVNPH